VTLAELVRDIGYFNSGWRPSDIEQRARLLREARKLPHAGRGRESPPVGPEHVATLLIGLAATSRAVEVVQAVEVYEALVPLRGRRDDALTRAPTFATALSSVVLDLSLGSVIRDVVICQSWPEATIRYVKGKKQKNRADVFVPSAGRPQRIDLIERCTILKGELLVKLGRSVSGFSAAQLNEGGAPDESAEE
jgi:hypothetical protein